MPAFPPIEGAFTRVRLRRLRRSDAASLFAIYSDAETMRYWSSPPLEDPEEARRMIESSLEGLVSGSHAQLGIELKCARRVIGTCTLFNFHEQSRRAEVGYILHREFWGNGYMTEALSYLIDYAFAKLGLNRLEADIDPRNAASARLLERLGFVREGLLRQRWIVGDEVSDTGFYGLLANERAITHAG